MKQIPLQARDGTVLSLATVDDEDFDALAAFTWRRSSTGYARRGITLGHWREKRIVQIRMHRVVMGLAWDDPLEVDHIDGDPLNNRRSNLRVGTHAENEQNRKPVEGAVPFRGVTFDRSRGKYLAAATVRGKRHNLGRYATAEEAGAAAAAFRAEHMGFAR